jgi:YtkA-like
MRTCIKNSAAVAILLGLVLGIFTSATWADVKDYEFQLVQSEMKKEDGAIVAVRLIYKKTGNFIPDAVIFAKRIDMAPEAMQEMTAPLEQLPSTEPGVYRFKTNLMMEGRWRLSLGAKVQGEEGTVASQVVLKAVP